MDQLPFIPGPPKAPTPKPLTRGQRIAIFVEDVLIVLSVAFLFVWVFFDLKGTMYRVILYATLAAMIVVFICRFRRIKNVQGEDHS